MFNIQRNNMVDKRKLETDKENKEMNTVHENGEECCQAQPKSASQSPCNEIDYNSQ